MPFEPLRPTDRKRVSDILAATEAFTDDEISVALELLDEAHAGPGADYEFIGARDEVGVLLGYACFGPTPSTDGTFDLYWLAVHPQAQGRGTGRQLIRWVEHQLAARKARLLVAETSSRADYARTREFYTRAGYVEAARVRDFYAPADDRIIFTTRLTTPAVGAATP